MIELLIIFTGWSSPIVLPKLESGGITSVDACVDSKNHIHVVWGQGTGYSHVPTDIFYTCWNGTSWTTPVKIQKESLPSGPPSLIIDDSDRIYIFWLEDRDTLSLFPYTDIFYTYKDEEGWKEPRSLYNPQGEAGWPCDKIRAKKDSKGNIYIVIPYSYSNIPGKMDYIIWNKSSKVLRESIPYWGYSPDFLIGEDEKTHFAYAGMPPGLPGVETALLYGSRLNGKWQDPVNIYSTLVCDGPKIVTAKKRLHIVWRVGYEDIFYSSSTDGISWSEPLNLTNEWGQLISKSPPKAVVDSKGDIHIVWRAVRGYTNIEYLCYMFGDGNSWSKMDTVFLDRHVHGLSDSYQKLVIDNQDRLYLFWRYYGEEDEDSIYYATKSIAGIVSEESGFNSHQSLEVSPNPIKQIVDVRYEITERGPLILQVYDASNRLVKTLVRTQNQKPGIYRVTWDRTDDKGKDLPNGIYFLRFEAGGFTQTEKLILIR